MNNIGATFRKSDGLSYYERAYSGHVTTSTLDQLSAMDCMVNLSSSHSELKRHDEANRMSRTAVDGYMMLAGVRTCGVRSYSTQEAVINLTSCLAAAHQAKEAAQLSDEYLIKTKDAVGQDHSFALRLLFTSDLYHQMARQNDEAERAWQQALTIRESSSSKDHVEIATLIYNLATLSDESQDIDRSRSLYQRSSSLRLEHLQNPYAETADTAANLAVSLYGAGELKRAVELLQLCTDMREKCGPEKYASMGGRSALDRWRRELADNQGAKK